ncbi:ABC transporter B family protein [Tieghemostelium lacteum]|uniref:ABC transporter B family protein n=1 Tax=Tieghemostelium lacteum TaxID=361077 RepID=A0A152A6E7_TIELA|nr:ABC transporter B family protein [Tieghemostelium lacteum]|eukprot:KYR01793.1 ABC transporter B family protein [Tieghemostelium lacteum]
MNNEVIKSPNDDRLYKYLKLENELSVILVSDPETDQASACVAVNVGSTSQPKDTQGLPHFLEHMLFLGTEKYPIEKDFTKFLGENGGNYNGTTSKMLTNYFYTINQDKLEESLDRFSSFFICPLFNADATEREINAVNSEHTGNLQNDMRRQYHMICNQLEHQQFSSFSCGNSNTLKQPQIREKVIEFYHRYYSSNQMSLCIYGRESLEQLEKWAIQYFGGIINRKISKPTFDGFNLNGKPKLIKMVPIKNKDQLFIYWPMPDIECSFNLNYKTSPYTLINNLLGHESRGSIQAYLKERGLSHLLSCGISSYGSTLNYISMTVGLTEKGMEQVDLVISCIYHFIQDKISCAANIPHYFYDEMQQRNKKNWENQPKQNILHYCPTLSQSLLDCPEPADVLRYIYQPMDYRNDKVLDAILKNLRADNMIVIMESQKFQSIPSLLTEEFYGIQYVSEEISDEKLKLWTKDSPLLSDKSQIYIPKENPFVPKDFTIKNVQDQSKSSTVKPELIFNSNGVKAYYFPDHKFSTPLADVRIRFETNQYGSAEALVNWLLFKKSLKELLNEDLLYYFHLTDVHFKFMLYLNHVELKIQGFNDKIFLAIEKLFDFLQNYKISQESFDRLKQRIMKKYHNNWYLTPYLQAGRESSLFISQTSASNQDKIDQLELLDYDDYSKTISNYLRHLNYSILLTGNLTKEETIDFADKFSKRPGRFPIRTADYIRNRATKLPKGKTLLYREALVDKDQNNGVLLCNFIIGKATPRTLAIVNLLTPILQPELFNQLRTVEQLGYAVTAYQQVSAGVVSVRMLVQSAVKDPHYCWERIQLFINSFYEQALLPMLSEDGASEFKEYRKSIIDKLSVHKRNISQLSDKYWEDFTEYNDFTYLKKIISALSDVSPQELVDLYKSSILSPNDRRLLLVQMYSQSMPMNNSKEVEQLENVKLLNGKPNEVIQKLNNRDSNSRIIHLQSERIDTRFSNSLSIDNFVDQLNDKGNGQNSEDIPRFYLVHFNKINKDIINNFKEYLQTINSTILNYIPYNSYLIYIREPSFTIGTLKTQNSNIQWINVLESKQKVSIQYLNSNNNILKFDAIKFKYISDNLQQFKLKLISEFNQMNNNNNNIKLTSISNEIMEIQEFLNDNLDQTLQWLSKFSEIYWIEPSQKVKSIKMSNEKAHFAIQNGNSLSPLTPMWNLGIQGQGEIIGCGDTGIDMNHCFFYDPNQATPNNSHRKIISYYSDNAGLISDILDGHGTHIVGSLVGNPLQASSTIYPYRGHAPMAKLTFVDMLDQLQNDIVLPQNGDMLAYYQLTHGTGAMIQCDSWNSLSGPFYSQITSDIDKYQYDNPQFLVVRSAGNSPVSPDYSTPYSISQESASKNSLVVGSLNQDNQAFIDAIQPNSYWDFDQVYLDIQTQVCQNNINIYGLQCSDLPNSPSQTVCCSSTVLNQVCCQAQLLTAYQNNQTFYTQDIISAFSAQGPASDGRIKPDLVAVGSPIISSRSLGPLSPVDHCGDITAAQPSVLAMEGTSQSAAVVAGVAALVRQYYREGYYLNGQQDSTNGFIPSASMIKATLLNLAESLDFPTSKQGFGKLSLEKLPFLQASQEKLFFNSSQDQITNSNQIDNICFLANQVTDITVSLVWTDPPASPLSALALVNDLDLLLTQYIDFNMTSYQGNLNPNFDGINNVEIITIKDAPIGRYDVYVFGTSVPVPDQPFSLIIRGNLEKVYCSECYYNPDDTQTRECSVKNGIGTQDCMDDNLYSRCEIYSCDSGYVLDRGITKSCVTMLALTLYNIVLLAVFGIILIGSMLFIFYFYKSKSLDQDKYTKIKNDQNSDNNNNNNGKSPIELNNISVSNKSENNQIEEGLGDNDDQHFMEQEEVEVSVLEVISLAKPESPYLIGGLLLSFVDIGLGLAVPLVSANIFDLLYSGQTGEISNVILTFALIIIGMIIIQFSYGILLALAGHKIIARLRKEMFHSILRQDMAFFNERKTGELMSRLASDVGSIRSIISDCIPSMITQLASVGGSLIMLFIISWKLSLVVLCPLPVLLIASHFYGDYIESISVKVQDALADAATHAAETLFNIKTVRWFSSEERENSKFSNLIQISYKIALKMTIWNGIYSSTSGIFEQLSVFILLWYGTTLVKQGDLTPSMLIAFNLFLPYITQSVTQITSIYTSYKSYKGSSYRFFEIMQRVPSILNGVGISRPNVTGNLEFNNVTFHYPGRPDEAVLENINISFKPGTITALIGPSGGGKSTMLSIIGRLYNIDSGGVIALDGQDIKDWNLENLHEHISIVNQEPSLFSGSIADNIAYGKPNATRQQIIDACRQANAHDFISALPQGYDTIIGERGASLSGGQKQRVAIARAIIKNPTILLLDEATSELDVESERLVQESIDSIVQNRTVIIVAHRLTTILTADIIAVVSEHKITEKGTPEELLAKKGLFYEFVQIQYGKGEGDDIEVTLPQRKHTKNTDKLRQRAETIKKIATSDPISIPNYRKSIMLSNNNNNATDLLAQDSSFRNLTNPTQPSSSTSVPLWRKGKKFTKTWVENKSSLSLQRNTIQSRWQKGNVDDKLQRVLEKTRKKGFFINEERKDIKGALLLY